MLVDLLLEALIGIQKGASSLIERLRNKSKKEPNPAQVEDSKRLRVHPTVYPPNWIDKEKPGK